MFNTGKIKQLEAEVHSLSSKLEKIKGWLSDFILPSNVKKLIVKYDSSGNIVYEKDDDGYSIYSSYDENGNELEVKCSDDENKPYSICKYEYDQFNNVLEIYKWRDGMSDIVHSFSNEYSTLGIIVRQKETAVLVETGEPYGKGTSSSEYDYSEGRETISTKCGNDYFITECQYDQDNNLVVIKKFKYLYVEDDSFGLRKEFRKGTPDYVIHRLFDEKKRIIATIEEEDIKSRERDADKPNITITYFQMQN